MKKIIQKIDELRGRRRTLKRYKGYIQNADYCEGGHHHICIASQILGSDLTKVCKHCTQNGFEMVVSDECDKCKYLCIAETQDGKLNLVFHKEICETFEK